MLYNTTVAQNKAHREDLEWIKVGKSEHMRSDGITIKRNSNTGRWELFAADGTRLERWGMPASAHSLTWAKHEVAAIDAEAVAA